MANFTVTVPKYYEYTDKLWIPWQLESDLTVEVTKAQLMGLISLRTKSELSWEEIYFNFPLDATEEFRVNISGIIFWDWSNKSKEITPDVPTKEIVDWEANKTIYIPKEVVIEVNWQKVIFAKNRKIEIPQELLDEIIRMQAESTAEDPQILELIIGLDNGKKDVYKIDARNIKIGKKK